MTSPDPRLTLIAAALTGILAADRREHGTPREARHVAAETVEYADAVLLALNPEPLPNLADEQIVSDLKW